MQTIVITITIEYRSDGTLDKSRTVKSICDLILEQDREKIFSNTATYAGYSIALDTSRRK